MGRGCEGSGKILFALSGGAVQLNEWRESSSMCPPPNPVTTSSPQEKQESSKEEEEEEEVSVKSKDRRRKRGVRPLNTKTRLRFDVVPT